MSKRDDNFWIAVLVAGFCITLLLGALGWNQLVYGDWTCAFSECRRMK